MPKFSIAITTYNRAEYLKGAIKSVLNQTLQDFEIIILDNASEDHTPQVVYSFQDIRIRYVRRPYTISRFDNGISAFDFAMGDYLLGLCDDDLLKPDCLAKIDNTFTAHKEVTIVGINFEKIDETGKVISSAVLPIEEDRLFRQGECLFAYLRENTFFEVSSTAFRLEVLRRSGLKAKEEVGPLASLILCFEVNLQTNNNQLYMLSDIGMQYRLHPGQHLREADIEKQMLKSWRYIYSLIQGHSLTALLPDIRRRIIYNMINTTLTSNKSFEADMLAISKDECFQIGEDAKLQLLLDMLGIDKSKEIITGEENTSEVSIDPINSLYKKWGEHWSRQKAITQPLTVKGCKSAIIFGTYITSYCLYYDLLRAGIHVTAFITNSVIGKKMIFNIPVRPLGYLSNDDSKYDVVISSIEGNHERDLINNVIVPKVQKNVSVISWKELLT